MHYFSSVKTIDAQNSTRAHRSALHVGIIANSYDPIVGSRAGGHVHLVEVAKRWHRFRLTVFAPESARGEFAAQLSSAEFVALPSCDERASGRAALFLYRSIASIIKVNDLRKCDVLICQSQFLPDIVPALVFGARNATVVLWHILEPPWKRQGERLTNYLAFIAERLALFMIKRFFSTVIVGSTLVCEQLQFTKTKQAFITTNGVEHLPIRPQPASLLRSGAVYVGRLHPTKGLDDLIDVWQQIRGSLAGEILTIAGDGIPEYRASLERRVAALQLGDSVKFAGAVSDDEKLNLLACAKIFVFPSREEGWGIALAEAMACGTPCVTYNLPIFDEIFPAGRRGAPIGDVNGLARIMLGLLTDESARAQVAAQARAQSRNFSWERAAQVEAHALESLPAARASRANGFITT
jgi:glycosyltransferase involved in cell wall biosynthesis